tara:strand:+ start:75128 stop:75754 length:627 start_codon:yes stop_codon:yes gene_type:complete
MDQLDLLKRDWKKQDSSFPKLTYNELSKLIHKKSSSIVKWLFIISILEFILPHFVFLFSGSDRTGDTYKDLGLTTFIIVFYSIAYAVIFYFIYRFYRNYKSISADSNPKVLMHNIIKTRRTVKHYIWFNLASVPIIGSAVLYQMFHSEVFLEKLPEGTNMLFIWLISIALLLVVVILFWLFYRLIYGILLNRLNANYNELISNGNSKS